MTNEQLAALKSHIVANTATIPAGQPWTGAFAGVQVKNVPNDGDGNFAVAGWYNLTAAPDFFVFRTAVPIDEIMANGFDWARVDNATVGKARIWDWMVRLGTINPSKLNIVAGINEAWSGAANDAHRASVFSHCQKKATNAEKLLKGAGAGTSITNLGAGPAIPGFAEMVQASDVNTALNLP